MARHLVKGVKHAYGGVQKGGNRQGLFHGSANCIMACKIFQLLPSLAYGMEGDDMGIARIP